MSKKQDLYTGSSGQLAVMSEFLARGYNVAIPQVDIGDDIFVVRDEDGVLSRVQVKAANAKVAKKGSYSASFNVGFPQLVKAQTPMLHFVFVVRHLDRWSDFIVVDQAELYRLHSTSDVGTRAADRVVFSLAFHGKRVICKGHDFVDKRDNWTHWPALKH